MSKSRRKQQTFTREELLQALRIEPCHVTGMHDPTHTTKHVCSLQRATAFERVLALLGVIEEELPHALHDQCYWCHHVPSQEEYRIDKRALHEWAGQIVPRTLAEPAPDAEALYKYRPNLRKSNGETKKDRP